MHRKRIMNRKEVPTNPIMEEKIKGKEHLPKIIEEILLNMDAQLGVETKSPLVQHLTALSSEGWTKVRGEKDARSTISAEDVSSLLKE